MAKRKTRSSTSKKGKKPAASMILPVFMIILIILLLLTMFLLYMFGRIIKKEPKPTEVKTTPTHVARRDCLPVYFYDSTAQYFVPVHMPLVDDAMFNEIRARKIVEQLVTGPPTNVLEDVMPSGTKVNSVKVDNNMAIVDLSAEVASYGGGSAIERGIVQSLLLSLTELPNITRIQILIDGKKKDYLPEGTMIKEPLVKSNGPNSDMSLPENQTSGYMYFLDKSRQFLVPVPWIWEGDPKDPVAKLAALYSKPPDPLSGSLECPAPEGLQVIRCEIKNGRLFLALNHDDFAYVFNEMNAQNFLEATYLTLLEVDKFSSAEIMIGIGDKALPIYSFAAFSKLEDMKIPPLCYNAFGEYVR